MTAIRLDRDAGCIWIEGSPGPFLARTLTVSMTDGHVSFAYRYRPGEIAGGQWRDIGDENGNPFASEAECMAYLRAALDFHTDGSGGLIVTATAAETILPGFPVTLSRKDGTMRLARASAYTLAFVAGIAPDGADIGTPARASRAQVTLDDWTSAAGTPRLQMSVPYFLAPDGGLSTIPLPPIPGTGSCSVRVGMAVSPQTFAFAPADPILL